MKKFRTVENRTIQSCTKQGLTKNFLRLSFFVLGMWITQIDCTENSIVQAPGGCNQYYFGKEGIIKTFNFEGVQYLAGQNYKMCIRANQDSCFVRYFADTNHFMLQVFFI